MSLKVYILHFIQLGGWAGGGGWSPKGLKSLLHSNIFLGPEYFCVFFGFSALLENIECIMRIDKWTISLESMNALWREQWVLDNLSLVLIKNWTYVCGHFSRFKFLEYAYIDQECTGYRQKDLRQKATERQKKNTERQRRQNYSKSKKDREQEKTEITERL